MAVPTFPEMSKEVAEMFKEQIMNLNKNFVFPLADLVSKATIASGTGTPLYTSNNTSTVYVTNSATGNHKYFVTNAGEDDMPKRTIKKDFNNVNSKILVAMIDDFVMDFIDGPAFSPNSAPHVQSAIDIFYDLFYDLEDEDKIMNFKIIADERNNPPSSGKRRDLNIDIYFRQTNCINQTHLRYTIHE